MAALRCFGKLLLAEKRWDTLWASKRVLVIHVPSVANVLTDKIYITYINVTKTFVAKYAV